MESLNLMFVRSIVREEAVQLNLHQHESGSLMLSAALENPSGIVFFATNEALLSLFCEGMITLQKLFEKSPSRDISILVNNNTRIYLCGHVNILLQKGDRKIYDLQH